VREPRDVSLVGIAVGAAIVLGGIALSVLAAALITAHVSAGATGASAGEAPKIEGPALQSAASEDLASFVREKHERLHSRGPIEGDASHVHIPIDEAMRILAKERRR
jgi:hypothetical protein